MRRCSQCDCETNTCKRGPCNQHPRAGLDARPLEHAPAAGRKACWRRPDAAAHGRGAPAQAGPPPSLPPPPGRGPPLPPQTRPAAPRPALPAGRVCDGWELRAAGRPLRKEPGRVVPKAAQTDACTAPAQHLAFKLKRTTWTCCCGSRAEGVRGAHRSQAACRSAAAAGRFAALWSPPSASIVPLLPFTSRLAFCNGHNVAVSGMSCWGCARCSCETHPEAGRCLPQLLLLGWAGIFPLDARQSCRAH